MATRKPARTTRRAPVRTSRADLPGQVILTMQGGGALGAYQAGVYEAMHEAGIEPDWVVGTSIGAINAALIGGNAPCDRLPRLRQFWDRMAAAAAPYEAWSAFGVGDMLARLSAVTQGIPGFFAPNRHPWSPPHAPADISQASFYTTEPLRQTLNELVDLRHLGTSGTRLTVGAVNARSGQMRYFDSRDDRIEIDHVMASGALPPAFPAVMIDGEPYWDGGIHSNTPIEVVMDDRHRRDSLIFAAELWQQRGEAGESIREVLSRLKDIQYSSRAHHHVRRQQQIHHLRHVIRELGRVLPAEALASAGIADLVSYGCGTVMHILVLRAPALDGEDSTKDIDFSPHGVRERWAAGYAAASKRIREAPWQAAFDPVMGVVVHE